MVHYKKRNDRKEVKGTDQGSRNMENIISFKKIVANIKSFWWLCVLCVLAAIMLVSIDTISTYRSNVAAAQKDSYVGSATIYLKSDNEKDDRAYGALLSSTYVTDRINEYLAEAGFDEYSTSTDSIRIQSMSDSTAYGITVLSIGESRTETIGRGFIAALESLASDEMQVQVSLLSELQVKPCIWYTDGSFTTVGDVSQRVVTLSLRDFITWRKMMVVAAGFFLGIALIFIAVIFDEKIRSEEELSSLFPGVYFGCVSDKEELENLRTGLKAYIDAENIKQACFCPLRHAKAAQNALFADGKVAWSDSLVESSDGYIAVIVLNKDKLKDARRFVNMAEVMHRRIIGYVTL